MKKRLIALSLLLLMFVSACSNTATTTTDTQTPADPVTEPETPAADTTESSADTAETRAPAEPAATTLPILDEMTTFKGWMSDSFIMTNAGQEKYEENHVLIELAARTNVNWEWESPPSSSASEKFNLMIISGDWPDMMIGGTYTGGYDKFIEDEVILDLYDLIEEHAPNYNAIYHADESLRREMMTDGGHMPAFRLVNYTLQPTFMGWFARQDWMDALGIEKMETYADWETYFAAVQSSYGATGIYLSSTTGQDTMLSGGYGVNNTFIAVDGEIRFSPVEEGYKSYLTMMTDWYSKGYIDKDFAGRQGFFMDFATFTGGEFGVFPHLYTFYDVMSGMGKGTDPNFEITAIPFPVLNSGDSMLIKSNSALTDTLLGSTNACLSATCADPVAIVKWFDYLFSDEGAHLANWGVEGDAYTMDGDEIVVSDVIVANPDGLAYGQVKDLYIMPSLVPFHYLWERELVSGISEAALDCAYTWHENWDIPNQYTLSTSVVLTTEESENVTTHVSDINTYVTEFAAKVIIGEESLDNWDTYVSNIYNMGLQDALDAYQAAYERYLAR